MLREFGYRDKNKFAYATTLKDSKKLCSNFYTAFNFDLYCNKRKCTEPFHLLGHPKTLLKTNTLCQISINLSLYFVQKFFCLVAVCKYINIFVGISIQQFGHFWSAL